MIEVLDADLSDLTHGAALVRLLNEYAEDEMGGGIGLSDYTKLNLVAALGSRCGVHVILAFVQNEPVGLAICFEGFSTFACKPLLNIHDIVVSKGYRGKGISKILLRRAEEIGRALGCCKLTLEVLEGNKVAQAAYQSIGFSAYQLDPRAGRAMFWQKIICLGK